MSVHRWTCSNAEQLLYSAERDLARAYYSAILAQIRLKQAGGPANTGRSRNVNRLLRPAP